MAVRSSGAECGDSTEKWGFFKRQGWITLYQAAAVGACLIFDAWCHEKWWSMLMILKQLSIKRVLTDAFDEKLALGRPKQTHKYTAWNSAQNAWCLFLLLMIFVFWST